MRPKKLSTKVQPKKMSLDMMWEAYTKWKGEETTEYLLTVVGLCYPGYDISDMDVISLYMKYKQADYVNGCSSFIRLAEGDILNGR